jgi:CRISPR/Cas system-associated exonuclease Cas4 (RecB family)
MVGRSEPTEKRLEKAQEQIGHAAAGIRARSFEATPSAMRCGYCPFREICPDASR